MLTRARNSTTIQLGHKLKIRAITRSHSKKKTHSHSQKKNSFSFSKKKLILILILILVENENEFFLHQNENENENENKFSETHSHSHSHFGVHPFEVTPSLSVSVLVHMDVGWPVVAVRAACGLAMAAASLIFMSSGVSTYLSTLSIELHLPRDIMYS